MTSKKVLEFLRVKNGKEYYSYLSKLKFRVAIKFGILLVSLKQS